MAQISSDTLARLRETVWPALENAYQLPYGLLNSIATYETRGTFRDETSPAGARGIFQLTPIALEQVRRDIGINFDPSNPYSASTAAAILLSRYFKIFTYPSLVVAAYNWGEGNVKKLLRTIATQGRGTMPLETRQYIVNTIGMI
jgi:soluble lytic murein transglycosylase-like protein